MTPKQKDELARMADGVVVYGMYAEMLPLERLGYVQRDGSAVMGLAVFEITEAGRKALQGA